jgi:hypothetical protein
MNLSTFLTSDEIELIEKYHTFDVMCEENSHLVVWEFDGKSMNVVEEYNCPILNNVAGVK